MKKATDTYWQVCLVWVTSPSRATARPGKTLSRGPTPSPILYVLRSRHRPLRGRKCGEGCPLTIRLGFWGSIVSSSRAPKMDFIHILRQNELKPSGTPFSVFLSNGGARENFPPSRRACWVSHHGLHVMSQASASWASGVSRANVIWTFKQMIMSICL